MSDLLTGWKKELDADLGNDRSQELLREMFNAYLHSPCADDQKERSQMLSLYEHLEKLWIE